MAENLAALILVLDSDDVRQLRGVDRNMRYLPGRPALKESESRDVLWEPEDENFVLEE